MIIMKIFEKILKNKFLGVLGIICLITLTCISLASAADVNTTVEHNDHNDVLVIDHIEQSDNSSNIDKLTVEEREQVNNILKENNLDPDMYKNPVIYKINNNDDFQKATDGINSENNNADLIIMDL